MTTPDTKDDSSRIFEKLEEILKELLNSNSITLESKISEDLGADSLDMVELVMMVEEEFGLDITDAEAEKLSTVGDIVNYIKGIEVVRHISCNDEFDPVDGGPIHEDGPWADGWEDHSGNSAIDVSPDRRSSTATKANIISDSPISDSSKYLSKGKWVVDASLSQALEKQLKISRNSCSVLQQQYDQQRGSTTKRILELEDVLRQWKNQHLQLQPAGEQA